MPGYVRVLLQAVEFVAGTLGGGAPAWVDRAIRAIGSAGESLLELGSMFSWLFARQKQAWHNSQGAVSNAIDQVGGAFAEQRIINAHIINDIIPSSTHHATGRLYNSDIKPLKDRLFGDELRIAGIQGTLDSDTSWIDNHGRPYVKWLEPFANTVWPAIAPWIGTLGGWIGNPASLADFIVDPLAGKLVVYYADPNHQQTRDNLVELLINASPDRFRYVEDAALAILQSPYP